MAMAAFFLLACSRLSVVNNTGGSGSTTTNGLVAFFYMPQGAPAAGSTWRVRNADYLAAVPEALESSEQRSHESTLDLSGRLAIDSIDSGAYVLEVNDRSGFSVAIRFFAPVDGGTLILKDTLKPSCRLIGSIPQDMQTEKPWFVQIYGLERLAAVDQRTGGFIFPEVPAGTFSLRLVSTSPEAVPVKIDSIVVRSGDTVLLPPFSAWSYSRTFLLNTTASGADVTHDVYDFPILVRLNGDNFNFLQARKDGADIRFTKPDGAVLPYEIERWDAVAMEANIWVRIDTVFGNDSSHAVLMFWGSVNAAGASDGAAVFDTLSSFAGVWHLNGNCDDATYHCRNGTKNGLSDAAGIIGACQHFNGNGYVKIPGLLGTPPALTLFAWANLDTVRNTGAEIVSVGDAALIRMDDVYNNKGTQGAYCVNPSAGVDSTHCFTKSGIFLKKTGWHCLAYSVDAAAGMQRLFIDGAPCCSTESIVPIVYNGVGSDVYFGKHGNGKPGFDFDGDIDEVRILSIACSEDWIKLSYMNQRQDDKLVKFK